MPGPPAAVAAVRHAVRGPLRAAAEEGAGVLVACSGGADSLALAAGLAFEADRLRRRGGRVLSGAVVVDHALQAGSAEVAARAAATCRALGLDPVLVRRVEVGRGDGPEAAAREARYDAFAEVLDGLGAPDRSVRVWLAHTADDQAEQVLLGLLRGAGTRSLAGMPARRGPYERPLLGLRRATTREACADQGLAPHQDPHNDDPRFARVRIRQALAVLGDAAGEDLVPALARSADHLRADADLLDALAAGRAAALTEHPGPAWPVEELAGVEAALRPRVWRRLVQRTHGAGPVPTHTHLAGLDRLLTGWTGQGPVHLPGGHRWARWRRDGVAVVGPSRSDTMNPSPVRPRMERPVDAEHMGDALERVLLTEEEILAGLDRMAREIAADYEGKDVLMVGVLKGAVMVVSDLMRAMPYSVPMDWMAISSYGSGTRSSGVVRILKDLDTDITDRHVLVVEDVIDSGLTLSWILENLELRGAASVEVATLLRKPEAQKVEIDAKYVGFDIPNDFVVGYGLDFDERFRNLRCVGTLAPHMYS